MSHKSVQRHGSLALARLFAVANPTEVTIRPIPARRQLQQIKEASGLVLRSLQRMRHAQAIWGGREATAND